ncbi:MAG: hypothetical protein WC523_04755 [Patescibacteria group bacterium]
MKKAFGILYQWFLANHMQIKVENESVFYSWDHCESLQRMRGWSDQENILRKYGTNK